MQVKKFEAKTMKEALELVKVHLGPEAIILSAKDSHRGFGLMGETSVEVTAAVSEETLRKKKVAESKLREDLKQRFHQIPATKQKEFINRVHRERLDERREMVLANAASSNVVRAPAAASSAPPRITPEVRSQLSGMRYIDIPDEDEDRGRSSRDRVRKAAERARSAGLEVIEEPVPQIRKGQGAQAMYQRASTSAEVLALESQVRELRTLVEKFQKMPQVPMSMHPGAEQGLAFELSAMYQRLTGQGVQPQLATQILKKAQAEMDPEQMKKPAMVDAWVVQYLLRQVEVQSKPTAGRYHVFMGCTGQGKTTTLVKFASQLILKEKKTIAIVSLDSIKVGAADQLRIYAQILNVPFAIVRTPEEWRMAEKKLGHIQHILVDCPGFNLRTMDEVDWLKRMLPPAEMGRSMHYVQSILARDEETFDIASRYQMLGFHDVIFTRLDESSKQGLLLNFQERFKVPLNSFGMGSRIPEDFEFATKERVVDFIFKLTKVTRREEWNG